MAGGIKKLLKKFNMENVKALSSPCVKGSLEEGQIHEKFPIRELVGGLLYISSVGRPDISYSVQRVARCITKCTTSVVKAGKRILSYLKGTFDEGIEYSPEIEADFKNVYQAVAAKGKQELPDVVAFSDADFAGCTLTLRSTTGSIMY